MFLCEMEQHNECLGLPATILQQSLLDLQFAELAFGRMPLVDFDSWCRITINWNSRNRPNLINLRTKYHHLTGVVWKPTL